MGAAGNGGVVGAVGLEGLGSEVGGRASDHRPEAEDTGKGSKLKSLNQKPTTDNQRITTSGVILANKSCR